jgi:hypothetical protein
MRKGVKLVISDVEGGESGLAVNTLWEEGGVYKESDGKK